MASLTYLLEAYTIKDELEGNQSTTMNETLEIILKLNKIIQNPYTSIEVSTIGEIYYWLSRADFFLLRYMSNLDENECYKRIRGYTLKAKELEKLFVPGIYSDIIRRYDLANGYISRNDQTFEDNFIFLEEYYKNEFKNLTPLKSKLDLGIIYCKYGILLKNKASEPSEEKKAEIKNYFIKSKKYFNEIEEEIEVFNVTEKLNFYYFYGLCYSKLGTLEFNNRFLNEAVNLLKKALNIVPDDNDSQQALQDVCNEIIKRRMLDSFED